jgi:ATP-dependent Clp protease protease subunit
MATLKIYNDIVGEEEKVLMQNWEGLDGVCYKDIQEFIASIPEDDKIIDIRLHCRGGDCVEGWAIYDALRRSKKTIYTTVEGECSSMATIILLAAPIERRTAYKNAHFCVHNPAVPFCNTDYPSRLTADGIEKISDQMQEQARQLRQEEDKMLNLYVQRTKATRSELIALMKRDTYIDTEKAIELGFISKTLVPNTASKKRNSIQINQTNSKMAKSKVRVEQGVINRLLAMCGLSKIEDVANMKAQEITSADGSVFTVEREDGDPQVGDTAYPDGTYVMDDGTTVKVENSVITEIVPAEDGDDDPNALDENELVEKVEQLEDQVDEQQDQIEQLEKDKEELENKLEALKGARVLSADENYILAKASKAGGRAWIDKVLGMSSTFTPQNRRFTEGNNGGSGASETPTQKALRERREKAANKRAARK